MPKIEGPGDPVKEMAMHAERIKKELALFKPIYRPLNSRVRKAAIRELMPELRPKSPPYSDLESCLSRSMSSASCSCLSRSQPSLPPLTTPLGSAKAMTEPPRSFCLGDRVQIAGMKRRQDLIGACGKLVLDVPDSEGKVCVQLFSPSKNKKVVRILASRLVPEEG
mmetsp:Transcript_101481/g.160468  ORF Transcript_101481/g.160468 Transcript_101481/m.160468 type:complete len:166 (+) Transcript_101481:57-554(+)|eukprot:CAMPEP_0169086056 /NCGR_PEP_ID=MMETSP1015-20121227/13492_1 /TAXON_ID=342587 /ORGANISM="Karlodinium micrum, Strain CCMP2283" /LENGTH=165 /DNA_ID=CAMNT_0009146189 /DNA_START=57 /DNA_END=554 /DNA_ORIENTATION=-